MLVVQEMIQCKALETLETWVLGSVELLCVI
jgi:hypothetical protein